MLIDINKLIEEYDLVFERQEPIPDTDHDETYRQLMVPVLAKYLLKDSLNFAATGVYATAKLIAKAMGNSDITDMLVITRMFAVGFILGVEAGRREKENLPPLVTTEETDA